MEILIIGVVLMVAGLVNIRIKRLTDNIEDIECKLEIMHAILLDLQPKVDKDLPVRLPENVLENLLNETRQAIEEYQIEKEEFQVKLKAIKEKY